MQYASFDIIGSLGVGLIILTYVLLQLEKLRSADLLYSLNGVQAKTAGAVWAVGGKGMVAKFTR